MAEKLLQGHTIQIFEEPLVIISPEPITEEMMMTRPLLRNLPGTVGEGVEPLPGAGHLHPPVAADEEALPEFVLHPGNRFYIFPGEEKGGVLTWTRPTGSY